MAHTEGRGIDVLDVAIEGIDIQTLLIDLVLGIQIDVVSGEGQRNTGVPVVKPFRGDLFITNTKDDTPLMILEVLGLIQILEMGFDFNAVSVNGVSIGITCLNSTVQGFIPLSFEKIHVVPDGCILLHNCWKPF
jgi:hypothetical protein